MTYLDCQLTLNYLVRFCKNSLTSGKSQCQSLTDVKFN